MSPSAGLQGIMRTRTLPQECPCTDGFARIADGESDHTLSCQLDQREQQLPVKNIQPVNDLKGGPLQAHADTRDSPVMSTTEIMAGFKSE